MTDIEQMAKDFIEKEQLTLRNALSYGGIGVSKTSGDVNRVIFDVGFSNHPYSTDRKRHMAEYLGEMLFYWHMLARTCDISPEEISRQYVELYKIKNNMKSTDRVSFEEMMRHVKPEVKMKRDEKKRLEKEREQHQRMVEQERARLATQADMGRHAAPPEQNPAPQKKWHERVFGK